MEYSEILITTIKGLETRINALTGEMLDCHLLTNTQGLVNTAFMLDESLARENIQGSVELLFALSNFRLEVSRVRSEIEKYQKAVKEIDAIRVEISLRRSARRRSHA